MINKEDYVCYDKDVDFIKCIEEAKATYDPNNPTDYDEDMLEDGVALDDDTWLEQLRSLNSEGEITDREYDFIVQNIDMLTSWANFRAYISFTVSDKLRDQDPDLADDIEHCPELLSDWTPTGKKGVIIDFIGDDFDEIKNQIEANPELIKKAVKACARSNEISEKDIDSAEIVIKHAKLVAPDSITEEECYWHTVDLSKNKNKGEKK